MARWVRRIIKATVILIVALIILAMALQWGINRIVIPRLVNKYAVEYLDATPRWSRIHLSLYKYLPRIRLEVDSLSLDFRSPLLGTYKPVVEIPRADIYAVYADRKLDGEGTLSTRVPGVGIDVAAVAKDVLGKDPRIMVDADADGFLRQLMTDLGLDLGFQTAGKAHLTLSGDARLSQLLALDYKHARLDGRLDSELILFSMPGDSLRAAVFAPVLSVGTKEEGVVATLVLDSLNVRKGASLVAKIRNMDNVAHLFEVEKNGQKTPRLELNVAGNNVFLRSGSSRMGLKSIGVGLQAQKRVRLSEEQRKRLFSNPRLDSLRRAAREKEAATDSLLLLNDLTFALDSSVTAMIREWNPTGSIEIGHGFVATPAFPLRTRILGLKGSFDGDRLVIDTLGVNCGTSNLSARGNMTGIRRTLRHKGYITTHLDISSHRLNINEIVAALQEGATVVRDTSLMENDESFVVDSIQNAQFDRDGIKAFLLPGNVDATVHMTSSRVDFKDILISPMNASVRLKDRVLQLSDSDFKTSVGNIRLSAYYATKSLDNLNLGMNLQLDSMRAHDIISLLPSVDSMMPVLKSFEGLLGCNISLSTQIDRNMMAIVPTMNGVVRLTGTNLNVSDVGDLRKITRLLMFRNKNIGHIEDLSVNAVLHNSRLEIFPFMLDVDRYKLALQGVHNFDGSMYYHVSVLKSPIPFRFGLDFYGTFDKWRFGLARAKYVDGKVPAFTRELDMMQVNIFGSIQDVFKRGVQGVEQYNEHYSGIKYDREPCPLEDKESAQVQIMLFGPDEAAEFEAESVAREAEQVIEETFGDIEDMIRSYQNQIYSKRELRRMEKAFSGKK